MDARSIPDEELIDDYAMYFIKHEFDHQARKCVQFGKAYLP